MVYNFIYNYSGGPPCNHVPIMGWSSKQLVPSPAWSFSFHRRCVWRANGPSKGWIPSRWLVSLSDAMRRWMSQDVSRFQFLVSGFQLCLKMFGISRSAPSKDFPSCLQKRVLCVFVFHILCKTRTVLVRHGNLRSLRGSLYVLQWFQKSS